MFRFEVNRWATAILLAVCVGISTAAVLPARAEKDVPSPLRSIVTIGEAAPGFTLKDVNGRNVTFRPGSGKPTLLVFWSVFCPLCKELTPATSAIATRSRKSLDVIGVNLDGKRFTNAVKSFLKDNGMKFPVGLDDIRNDLFIASDPYGVEKTPTAVLVEGSGKVYRVYVADKMRDLIKNFDAETAGLKTKGAKGKK
ncbi:MAG TPA: TlpA disulfide reductase family protein [Candidatus Deferrimicrobiaceae bacterium]|jgi:peroxiredoxin